MTRPARMAKGDWRQFETMIDGSMTAEEINKLRRRSNVWRSMLEHMRTQPGFNVINDRWTPLPEILENMKGWVGVSRRDLEAAELKAREDGTIAVYERLSVSNPHLALVVCVTRDTLEATIRSCLSQLREAWGRGTGLLEPNRDKLEELLASGEVERNRDALGFAERGFCPNEIRIDLVDFRHESRHLSPQRTFDAVRSSVSDERSGIPSHLHLLFALLQHPEWVYRVREQSIDTPDFLLGVWMDNMTSMKVSLSKDLPGDANIQISLVPSFNSLRSVCLPELIDPKDLPD